MSATPRQLTERRSYDIRTTGKFLKLPAGATLRITGAEKQWERNPNFIYHLPTRYAGTPEQLQAAGVTLVDGEYLSFDNTREGGSMFSAYQWELENARNPTVGRTRVAAPESATPPDVEVGDIFSITDQSNEERYAEVVGIVGPYGVNILKQSPGGAINGFMTYKNGRWVEDNAREPQEIRPYASQLTMNDVRRSISDQVRILENTGEPSNLYAYYDQVRNNANIIEFKGNEIVEAKTKAGAIVALLESKSNEAENLGWSELHVVEFINLVESDWLIVLEVLYPHIKQLPFEFVKLPQVGNVKSARKQW